MGDSAFSTGVQIGFYFLLALVLGLQVGGNLFFSAQKSNAMRLIERGQQGALTAHDIRRLDYLCSSRLNVRMSFYTCPKVNKAGLEKS